MQVSVIVQVLRVEERSGDYLDKVSGQRKSYHATRLYCVDADGYTAVLTWISETQKAPDKGQTYTFFLRKFEDSSTGATGIATGYAE